MNFCTYIFLNTWTLISFHFIHGTFPTITIIFLFSLVLDIPIICLRKVYFYPQVSHLKFYFDYPKFIFFSKIKFTSPLHEILHAYFYCRLWFFIVFVHLLPFLFLLLHLTFCWLRFSLIHTLSFLLWEFLIVISTCFFHMLLAIFFPTYTNYIFIIENACLYVYSHLYYIKIIGNTSVSNLFFILVKIYYTIKYFF